MQMLTAILDTNMAQIMAGTTRQRRKLGQMTAARFFAGV